MMCAINLFYLCFAAPPKKNFSPIYDTEVARPGLRDLLDEPTNFAPIPYGPNYERNLSKYRSERKDLLAKKLDDDED